MCVESGSTPGAQESAILKKSPISSSAGSVQVHAKERVAVVEVAVAAAEWIWVLLAGARMRLDLLAVQANLGA
jgi:hypothetical protein